jgi:hypothetical protein
MSSLRKILQKWYSAVRWLMNELPPDFGVGQPVGWQSCDLRFLGCEEGERVHGAPARRLAGGQ